MLQLQSTANIQSRIQSRMEDEMAKLKALIAFGHERGLALPWIEAHGRINHKWFDRQGCDYGCSEFIAQSIDEVAEGERFGILTRYQAECAYGALVALYEDKNYLQHCRKFGF
jgi:hypothetical protein